MDKCCSAADYSHEKISKTVSRRASPAWDVEGPLREELSPGTGRRVDLSQAAVLPLIYLRFMARPYVAIGIALVAVR
jgi:hypothetical protein